MADERRPVSALLLLLLQGHLTYVPDHRVSSNMLPCLVWFGLVFLLKSKREKEYEASLMHCLSYVPKPDF
ncbi:hypothetical protein STEG23_007531 [Scotinomys teguina]